MGTKKIAYVAKTRRGKTTIWAGTIEELRTNVFGYTLECGNSWNKKISREPKSVASLVNNLNKSVDETQGGRYERDYYEVATKEQYDAQEAAKAPKHEVENSKVNNEQEVKQSNKSKNMATKANKTVKVEDSKSVNKAVENFDAPVMDERIVKLNELKAVKMAAISSKKRPAAKEAKELATYILNNWDNLAELKNIKSEDVTNEDIQNILNSRLKNFEDASKAAEEAVKEEKLTANDIVNNKDNKLTAKEIVLLNIINESPDVSFGEEYSALDCNDVAKIIKWDVKTVKGVLGSLVKKNILSTYDTGTGYEVIIFVQQQIMTYKKIDEKVLAEALLNSEEKKAEPAKAEKAPTKKEAKKADKEEQPKEKKAKTARKVGDVHPNHPTWIWTEYAEGKFDWRTNPADKKQGQRTDKATTSAKKSEPKKVAVSKKAVAKETNKKVTKGGKVEKEAPKELTIDEFVALPSKTAKGNKKPSEAQKEALKLIMKGYRVTADHKFFENAEGDKKACNWESVVAMLRRYGMEYVPAGLVK